MLFLATKTQQVLIRPSLVGPKGHLLGRLTSFLAFGELERGRTRTHVEPRETQLHWDLPGNPAF